MTDDHRWVVSPWFYSDIVAILGEEYAAAHFLAWEYLPTETKSPGPAEAEPGR